MVDNIGSHEDYYQLYIDKITGILKALKNSADNPDFKREVVGFSDEAEKYWVRMFNEIERNLQVGGRFQHARDHGSKLAENIARIAALLSYFEQGRGEKISLGILMDAERVAFYFSDHYLRSFNVLPGYVQDVLALEEHFQTLREDGVRYVRKNKIRQSGPSRLRDKAVLDQALFSAGSSGSAKVHTLKCGMMIIDLNPGMFFDKNEWNAFCWHNKCPQYAIC